MVAYKNLYTKLLIYLYYYDNQFNSINSFLQSVELLVYRVENRGQCAFYIAEQHKANYVKIMVWVNI